jgi:hypothetical protein
MTDADEVPEAPAADVSGNTDNITAPAPKRRTKATASDPTPWRDPKCDRLPGESRRAMQKRLGRKGGRPRNPALEQRFVPTDQDREVVKLLSGFGLPLDRIARAVRNPATRRCIAVTTLQARFERELEEGSGEVDRLLAGTLLKQLKAGQIAALIFTLKNRWGWRDLVEQQRHTEVDLTVRLTAEELQQKLRERGLPLSVFGDTPVVLEHKPASGNGNAAADVRPNGPTLQQGGGSLLAFDDDENDGGDQ